MFALIDRRASASVMSSLKIHGFEPITLPPAPYLAEGVASHADMLVFIAFGRLFCHATYYASNKKLLDRIISLSGLELTLSHENIGDKYPDDVIFNACIIGNRLICNKKTVSKLILDSATNANHEIIHVPQGYTKCSVTPVGDNALITADTAIADACSKHGMNVLLISKGHVSLPPYEYGFLGGASGICGSIVYFCGSLDTHPDGETIKSFCAQNGAKAIELSNDKLQDVGTIFFI